MYSENDKKVWMQRLDGLHTTQPDAVAIAREILKCDEFNGWVNRESCVLSMHLSSDQDLYQQTLARIDDAKSVGEAAVFIERWVKEKHSILHHEPPNRIAPIWLNVLADAGSLWRIDWQEVAAHFID